MVEALRVLLSQPRFDEPAQVPSALLVDYAQLLREAFEVHRPLVQGLENLHSILVGQLEV